MFLLLLLFLTAQRAEVGTPGTDWPSATSHTIRETDQGFTSIQQPEDYSFSSCFNHSENAFSISLLNSASWNFTCSSPTACWVYCEHLKPCQTIAFEYLSSACLLFETETFNIPNEAGSTISDLNIGTLHKSCVETFEAKHSIVISLGEAVQLGAKEKGVTLHFVLLNGNKCLSMGKSFSEGRFLDVVECSKADEFVVREVRNGGPLRIYYRQNTTLCVKATLIFHLSGYSGMAYLAKCDDDRETHSQNLEIEYDPGITAYSIYSALKSTRGYMLFLDENYRFGRQLESLAFRLPKAELGPTCPKKQFKLLNSMIVDSPPMFLPGASVTILCDHGYGVPSLDYYPYQVVGCLTDHPTRPEPCRMTPPREAQCMSRPVILVLVVVLVVLVVVLVMGGVCVVTVCHKASKRGEGSNGPHRENRTDTRQM